MKWTTAEILGYWSVSFPILSNDQFLILLRPDIEDGERRMDPRGYSVYLLTAPLNIWSYDEKMRSGREEIVLEF